MTVVKLNAWFVCRGHDGGLVAIQNPSASSVIVDGPFRTKADALDFIYEREREQRISQRVFVAFAVIALGGVAWGVWA